MPYNKKSFFIKQSKLNKGQRKYCHCLMKFRLKNLNKNKKTLKNNTKIPNTQYYQCYTIGKYFSKLKKPKNKKYNQYKFDPKNTNCVMNYNYDNYTINEIRAFCLEKKIPISYLTYSNNKTSKTSKPTKSSKTIKPSKASKTSKPSKTNKNSKTKKQRNTVKYYSKNYLIGKLISHYLKKHKK